LGGEQAVAKGIAFDAALLPRLATVAHRLADAERHEGGVIGVVVDHLVETLREKRAFCSARCARMASGPASALVVTSPS